MNSPEDRLIAYAWCGGHYTVTDAPRVGFDRQCVDCRRLLERLVVAYTLGQAEPQRKKESMIFTVDKTPIIPEVLLTSSGSCKMASLSTDNHAGAVIIFGITQEEADKRAKLIAGAVGFLEAARIAAQP